MSTHPDSLVLVANHEPAVLGLLTTVLTAAGYRVAAVRGPDRYTELLADPGHGFDAAVLAEPSARDLLAARAGRPGLPVVVTAASLDPGVAEAIAADPHACLLPKPFRPDEVVRAVADLLGGGGIRAPAGPGRLP